MIAEERPEVFHFVLSFGPTTDIDRFCEALACVVAQNTILRTRIVEANPHGLLQVVVDEAHITERREKGQVEAYVSESQSGHNNMRLGARLFRSAFVGRVFVAMIHHAVMDYWSMTTLMSVDVASVYYGQVVATRPPFKDFVTYWTRVNDSSARSFWAARFKGISSVFPDVARDQVVVASAKPSRKIVLGSEGWDIPSSHMPYYIEAAWALTAAAYSYSDSTAYGLVLSGRSSALNGLEYTLGPTIVEVPIQTNIQRNRSIDRLIRDRATSLRQLQSGSAIWYDTSKIAAMNEATKAASGFKTLLNIRPNMPVIVEDEYVRFERMVWLRGSFPLQLVCSIMEDGVMVEPRCDASVLPDRQLHRVLEQFEYVLRKLVFSPARTKLDDLDFLNRSNHFQSVNVSHGPLTQGIPDATVALWRQGVLPGIIECPPQVESISNPLWSFVGYLDNQKRSVRFRVNKNSKAFQTIVRGHVIAQAQPLCPSTLQLDTVIEALMSLRPGLGDKTYIPQLVGMISHAPMTLDSESIAWLTAQPTDNGNLEWEWSISNEIPGESIKSSPTTYVTGKTVFCDPSSPTIIRQFPQYERLVRQERCRSLLEGDANDVIGVIGLQKLVAKGRLEYAGVVALAGPTASWLNYAMTDCFRQVAGIFVNTMTERPQDTMYISDRIDQLIRSPRALSGPERPPLLEVYVCHDRPSENEFVSDVFVFDPDSGELVEVILAIHYRRTSRSGMSRALVRMSILGAPPPQESPHSTNDGINANANFTTTGHTASIREKIQQASKNGNGGHPCWNSWNTSLSACPVAALFLIHKRVKKRLGL
ncbi:putative AMP-dependent synthetase/ligase domain-containing protein [Seiridium cardinale]|uniref:AMP-dependent synthetase/ligase domain-containing protein n=1 Tax=Seiridium cardinale TaxID=138064 RepID=A0ABR2Y9K8_9PEZI